MGVYKLSILENVQLLCKEHGISVPGLEKELGLGKGSIYRWNKNSPSVDKLQKVANYFRVSLDQVVGRADIYDYGWIIKEERHSQGMTLEEVSQETGLASSTIKMIEEDANPMTDSDLESFAKTFGYSTSELLDKYGRWDDAIPEHFNGDVNAYLKFKKAEEKDAQAENNSNANNQEHIHTIAAHHDGDEWTEEELEEIELFKEFVRSKRRQQGD